MSKISDYVTALDEVMKMKPAGLEIRHGSSYFCIEITNDGLLRFNSDGTSYYHTLEDAQAIIAWLKENCE